MYRYKHCFIVVHSLMKDYFFKPPINKISLNFLERPLEKAYHSSYKEEVHMRAQTHTQTLHVTLILISPIIPTDICQVSNVL